ncbi:MFS transporter [Agromyces protaetiae]|uniref:Multidrug efflux pump Tap n=1 Tax=Agromyces protaetiae TaxID=2509455 RepID=A0A4P6FJG7_9MICO|nr:MFS transporter [Agromyces protaetiae]QAY74749.1 MFS transporter [Agromyces protaetiae]
MSERRAAEASVDGGAAAFPTREIPDAPRRRLPLVALFTAQFASLSGNALAMVAIPILALQQTGSPLAAGTAGVFATVPLVIGGALGGVLVDRFGFRISSIVADLASALAVAAVPLLHATVGLPFGALLALVFLGGLLDTPGDTAKTSLMPDLAALARTPLARAAGAQSAVQRTASMIGAGLAGVLVASFGAMSALVVDAIGFAVAAGVIAAFVPRAVETQAVAPDAREAGADASAADGERPSALLGSFAAGIRFVWRTPLLRALVALVTLTNAIDAAGVTVLKPVYATRVLGDPALLGFMLGCFAAGALAGSALFGAVGHRVSGRVMFALCFVLAGAPPYLAMAAGAEASVLLPVLVLSGLAAGSLNPMISTAMYGLVPEGMRARVFGATTAGVAATMPLGALCGGLAVEAFGLVPTLAGAGLLYAALGASPLLLRTFSGLAAARA